jgi:hypothetical protein
MRSSAGKSRTLTTSVERPLCSSASAVARRMATERELGEGLPEMRMTSGMENGVDSSTLERGVEA